MTAQPSNRGRRKKSMDLSKLYDADRVEEERTVSYYATCRICGSRNSVACFNNKMVCSKCINFIKARFSVGI